MQHLTKAPVCSNLKTAFRTLTLQQISDYKIFLHTLDFILLFGEKYNLKTEKDWKSVTRKQILSNGGSRILKRYSLFEFKYIASGTSRVSIFKKPKGYWKNEEKILKFLSEIKEKYNLNTPDDWNSIKATQIQSNGGSSLLKDFSMFELKCLAFPEGKSTFNTPPQSSKYWENEENVDRFISELKQKYNLNTPEDWNSITRKQIQLLGGSTFLNKYSMHELKIMACPEGKQIFNNINQVEKYWREKQNVLTFLTEIKEKYNLNTPEDWNSITPKHIQASGGWRILRNYSLFELKCMACPEGKSIFNNPKGYWKNEENVLQFLSEIKEKYNLNTPEDWNSITATQIQSNGGSSLLSIYSLYELKCMACPEGKLSFTAPKHSPGYWENKENVDRFISEFKEKYNLHTPEDWKGITRKHIQSQGGGTLLKKYSMFELKCMTCPEGKVFFKNPNHQLPGYWENKENLNMFFDLLKEKYNLNTPEDWNSITTTQIISNGGRTLLHKYSMFELKCMACPEGKLIFNSPPQSSKYWENKENVDRFISELKEKYNLHTPEDWKRISANQIIQHGGRGLLFGKNDIKIQFDNIDNTKMFISFKKLISLSGNNKRSSQRWLFLQVQKLFPHDEIVEDYFHPEISRLSGANVQFDIYLIQKKIAIEYHGKQHYEDIPSGFSSVETYQFRDLEKEKLCKQHGINLIVVPYWWDNNLDSLRTYLYSKIN